MPRFPSREADVASLANRIISGLKEHAEDFPNPPHGPDELEATVNAYEESYDAAVLAQGAAAAAVDTKGKALETLTDRMKVVLRYAEDAANFDSAKLKSLGWNGRRTRSELEPPGQAGVLEAKREGPGWVYLEWKKPVDGGTVAAYHIQLLREGEKQWREVTTCFETMTVLTDQEQGVELKYRVVSANKAGTGVESNVITVVL
jgi:hypothetical protein